MIRRAIAMGALLATACGARTTLDPIEGSTQSVSSDDAGARPTCPTEPAKATGDLAEDCASYCAAYACLECPTAIDACVRTCIDHFTRSGTGYACFECAVEHVTEHVVSALRCDDFTKAVDGSIPMKIVYPTLACPMCTH